MNALVVETNGANLTEEFGAVNSKVGESRRPSCGFRVGPPDRPALYVPATAPDTRPLHGCRWKPSRGAGRRFFPIIWRAREFRWPEPAECRTIVARRWP